MSPRPLTLALKLGVSYSTSMLIEFGCIDFTLLISYTLKFGLICTCNLKLICIVISWQSCCKCQIWVCSKLYRYFSKAPIFIPFSGVPSSYSIVCNIMYVWDKKNNEKSQKKTFLVLFFLFSWLHKCLKRNMFYK